MSKDGEFRNWAASVQTAPAKIWRPKSVREVQGILAQVCKDGTKRTSTHASPPTFTGYKRSDAQVECCNTYVCCL